MRALLIASSALLLGAAASAAPQGPQPKVGEPFPLQTFPRLEDGELASLADYRGEKVLLVQFASW